jgi:AraC family transcriptional regulator
MVVVFHPQPRFIVTLGLLLARRLRKLTGSACHGDSAETVTAFAPTKLTANQKRRIDDFLKSDLSADLSLDCLANQVGMSRFHFARAFKSSAGVPPYRFLIQLRIEKARELLELTNLPITYIAAQIGYDDPGYFARLFRNNVWITPAQYRRLRR